MSILPDSVHLYQSQTTTHKQPIEFQEGYKNVQFF